MTKQQKSPPQSLWRDDSDRFSDDHLLRRLGWVVISRPKDGDAIWRIRLPDGTIITDEFHNIMERIHQAEK